MQGLLLNKEEKDHASDSFIGYHFSVLQSADFDVEIPSTWGFAEKMRLVVALAVQSNRLYYSVAEPLEVWSVGINADGNFASDARREIAVNGTPAGNLITSIAFDGPGTLYLTQRGDLTGDYAYASFARPQASVVFRCDWSEQDKAWQLPPDEFAIALEPPHRATDGGLALGYGYQPDGDIDLDQCRQTLWTTGEHLRAGTETVRVDKGGPRIVHGLQGSTKTAGHEATLRSGEPSDAAGARPVESGNQPPWQSWFVDNDGRHEDPDVNGIIAAQAATPARARLLNLYTVRSGQKTRLPTSNLN